MGTLRSGRQLAVTLPDLDTRRILLPLVTNRCARYRARSTLRSGRPIRAVSAAWWPGTWSLSVTARHGMQASVSST